MTDAQIIALVARATDIIIRALAPASACAPREDLIRRQLAAAVAAASGAAAPEPSGEIRPFSARSPDSDGQPPAPVEAQAQG